MGDAPLLRSYFQGAREVVIAPWHADLPGPRRRFASEPEADAFLAALVPGPTSRGHLRALLPLLPFDHAALDDERLAATLARALLDETLRVYERELTRYGGGGDLPPGPGPGPGPTPGPVEPDAAKVTASAAPAALWVLESRIADADDAGNAFEGSTLKITARLLEGTSVDPAGALAVVRHEGAEVAAHPFDPTAGTHDWEHVTETLPEAETSRKVRARMTLPGDLREGDEDWILWPKTVTLRARHRDANTPLVGFTFKVLQPGGGSVEGTTDATGSVDITLPKPAPFQVFAEPPSEITSWVDKAGRVREAKGVTAFKAAIVKPAKPATGSVIKQHVNLASTANGQDGRGHALRVEVKGEAPARAGDPVFVRVRFGRQSRRNSPLPAVTGLADLNVESGGFLVTGRVTLGASLTATFGVELGIAGGDTCDIAVGGTRAARDDQRSVENWRKVFYQVTRPSTMATPSLALMTASLAKVFVEYEKYKEVTFDEADAGTPAGAWFDGIDFGLTVARAVNIGDHNKDFFHKKFDDAHSPVGVHVLFCHAQFDGGKPAHKTALAVNVGPATAAQPHPLTGANFVGVRAQIAGHVFPKAFQDGKDSVRDVTWRSLAASGPTAGASGAIGAADIYVDWMNDQNFVTITLPPAALAVVTAGGTVQVKATVLWSAGVFLGESDGKHGNWQLIRNNENDGAAQTNAVMTHELGHTLFMVLKTVPPGTAAGAHGYRYEARGHQGPHCGFGVAPAVFAGTGSLGGAGGACVMFGESSAATPSDFCPRCAPFVNAQDLRSIV